MRKIEIARLGSGCAPPVKSLLQEYSQNALGELHINSVTTSVLKVQLPTGNIDILVHFSGAEKD